LSNQKSWFLTQSSIPISYLSCVVMIHGLMELFGWPLDCIQTRNYVKIHLKSSCSTACTKSTMWKDTYGII